MVKVIKYKTSNTRIIITPKIKAQKDTHQLTECDVGMSTECGGERELRQTTQTGEEELLTGGGGGGGGGMCGGVRLGTR